MFEKKWIVSEVGDDSASYLPPPASLPLSQDILQVVSLHALSSSFLSSLPFFQMRCYPYRDLFQGGLEKNGIIFDPNIDSSSETTGGTYPSLHYRCYIRSQTPLMSHFAIASSSLRRPSEWEDESPYPEVRSAVSNTDDMEMPVDTFRAWTIGLFWAIVIPGLNQFLYFRYPSITIGSVRPRFCTSLYSPMHAYARAVPKVVVEFLT